MPRREASFAVNAPPEELWRFIRDFHSLCTCIPGVERIQVLDDRTAELTVKEKVGVVPLIVTLRAQIESEEPPRRLHASAKAEHLTMAIDVTLRGTATGTELTSLFDVRGEGQLKAIVDRLFERRATERTAQFAECLGRHFGAAPSARAAPPRASRVRQWLARIWQRLLGRPAPSGD
ncbi:MAG TPA: SRPBCC domain-containing protein [Burkholderiales bacterium]|nr:SRPBCC domain-containing protein [Burkholderiales bacterium]